MKFLIYNKVDATWRDLLAKERVNQTKLKSSLSSLEKPQES